jgi:thiol:disulfide interchange protein DsbD
MARLFNKSWWWLGLVVFSLTTSSASFQAIAEGKIADDIRPEDVIHFTVGKAWLRADSKAVRVSVSLTTEHGFTIYEQRLKLSGPEGATTTFAKKPATQVILDPMEGHEVNVFASGEFVVEVTSETELPSFFEIGLEFTGCTKVICLFPHTTKLTLDTNMMDPWDQSVDAVAATTGASASASASEGASASTSSVERLQEWILSNFKSNETPLWFVLIIVFIGGLISNLTPCVYPMIPITIRILSTSGHAMKFAFCYGTGIVVTYTSLGVFAGLTGSMFGKFMQNIYVNAGFAVLMLVLGLGMLGFGNLSAIQNLGTKLGTGKPSPRNTFLMGMGAGLVAAPCTGPIMLALLGYAANTGSVWMSVVIFLTYSTGFALPYVFLGASASKITKRTFSHHVQVGVKIVFASVMFALSFYYLRVPFHQQIKVLSEIWVPLSYATIGLGLVVMLVFLAKPSLENNKALLTLPALVLGLGIFSSYKVMSNSHSVIKHYHTEAEAFAAASKSGKKIFIDGWAEWCLACIEMDNTTFLEDEVVQELTDHWIFLKLDLTESTDENDRLIEKYGWAGLPGFALLPSDGSMDKMKTINGRQEKGPLMQALQEYRTGQ